MTKDFVTIKTYYDSINAHQDKTKLEAAGLDCILLAEETNNLKPAWAVILVHLLVQDDDVETAAKILCFGSDTSVDETELTEFDLEADSDFRNAS